MTLFLRSSDVEMIPARRGVKCVHCEERKASYLMEPVGGGKRVPLCGWCVLYGGSQWGEENREELLWSGEYVKGVGMKSGGKNTIVPKLDGQHRMFPLDAERYLAGIIFTSRVLENGPLARVCSMSILEGDDGGE